jgi:hypothetical protein
MTNATDSTRAPAEGQLRLIWSMTSMSIPERNCILQHARFAQPAGSKTTPAHLLAHGALNVLRGDWLLLVGKGMRPETTPMMVV